MSDEQRFTELYRRNYAAVEAYVTKRADPSSVLDVVADVFLTAWRRFADMPEGKELPWLYGVARRTLANDRRSRQRQLSLAELLAVQPSAFSGERQPDDVIIEMDLAKAFDCLSLRDQEILRLTLWEKLPINECALAMGCGTATARVRLFRARKRLGGFLSEMDSARSLSDEVRSRKESHA
ncbi:sigma-70 family RNA polymerase sigma factor [Streptomyces sp. RLB1-33]|uniref:RNA polymerase sigma factor n=1 Tax=Streptomyces mirabilis TaxID=68239 RepID=UPI00143E2F2C|nr:MULTISPECIES: sigma-70 family RNA polymerase sigma factor [Streptomyces]QIY72082.1 sigma-70 family RNA polymerase sigma factor [Streptomyces sp. RLB1-33]QUW80979.1 sigma-70 family RNA polymerase sigma factor [Streptomyces mirabilis]